MTTPTQPDPAESKTPRTDEKLSEFHIGGVAFAPMQVQIVELAIFARQLETELAAITKERDEFKRRFETLAGTSIGDVIHIEAERDQLRQRVEELKSFTFHRQSCRKVWVGERDCDCGLEALLSQLSTNQPEGGDANATGATTKNTGDLTASEGGK